jgi:hypothetical protein
MVIQFMIQSENIFHIIVEKNLPEKLTDDDIVEFRAKLQRWFCFNEYLFLQYNPERDTMEVLRP